MIINKMCNWGFGLPSDAPVIISGPCSAESFEQIIQSCLGVAENGAHILRAGVWKPRTRPQSFEGVGEKSIPWLKSASKLTGLPLSIEVATPWHVETALKHEIDLLWIGTRTTVSPFAVQEIANALEGVDIPIFVKNPINPDAELWLGAIERLIHAGITKIAAIHRGFNVPQSAPYRNLPMWEIPIQLQKYLPGIEMICDPSHICGSRNLIFDVALRALELDYRGLMIESHFDPSKALSDRAQQITPNALSDLLVSLEKSLSLHLQH